MKFILQIVFLLIGVNTYSQDYKISGVVTDLTTQEVLEYANVMMRNYAIGTSTDSNGLFELVLHDSLKYDSLVISYVGYNTIFLALSDIKDDTIQLESQNIKLSEIIIRPFSKRQKPIFINPFKSRQCFVRYDPVTIENKLWIPYRPKEPTIEALYFPNEGSKTIKEIWLQVTNYKTPPTHFNLRLFKADESHSPDGDLIGESLVLTVNEKSELVKVNLEKYNIIMPQNGLFVGFELLIIDENKSERRAEENLYYSLYSPYLNFLRKDTKEYFWLYTKGQWTRTFQETPHFLNKTKMVYLKPAISLVLTD